jgi:hypothetical protein
VDVGKSQPSARRAVHRRVTDGSASGQRPVTRGIVPCVPPQTHVVRSLVTGDRKETRFMLAYLDAASGSMIVQAIVAGAAGAAVFLKLGWRRISSPFRRRPAAEVGERDDR